MKILDACGADHTEEVEKTENTAHNLPISQFRSGQISIVKILSVANIKETQI